MIIKSQYRDYTAFRNLAMGTSKSSGLEAVKKGAVSVGEIDDALKRRHGLKRKGHKNTSGICVDVV